MVKSKKFVLTTKFVGEPKLSDFSIVEEDLPALKDGEVLAASLYNSVDPYMRAYMDFFPAGTDVIGGQIAKVIESKNKSFPKDSFICGQFGWRTHTIFNPAENKEDIAPYVLPSFGKHSVSLGLGTLGMPGITAHFGLSEICKPKVGETIAVTGAAGAVGSIVGQIGKISGCKVIGFAGSDDKCALLKKDLGFDHVINYKTENVADALKVAAPQGIDCYFDNVGGDISSQIINHMNVDGRVAVCGSISSYNALPEEMPTVPLLQPTFVRKQLKMEGFLVWRYANRWLEGIDAMYKLVEKGQIKSHETVTVGFENLPQAFIDMLRGKNTGKAIVQI